MLSLARLVLASRAHPLALPHLRPFLPSIVVPPSLSLYHRPFTDPYAASSERLSPPYIVRLAIAPSTLSAPPSHTAR
ncbi:hypothetical protein EXIGLDRAFT_726613 [Exidia glandulosa HHB12029]|uniref:Uncharacterized protein n=1 Tax=Exidia glandulosa HHB12029 TaxID=1314781 RepID=A0A165DMX3_EXIGL|nr:hypothetical protein EXIGLDRAFT_726613 [Exidia glandulosa HHB12029]